MASKEERQDAVRAKYELTMKIATDKCDIANAPATKILAEALSVAADAIRMAVDAAHDRYDEATRDEYQNLSATRTRALDQWQADYAQINEETD